MLDQYDEPISGFHHTKKSELSPRISMAFRQATPPFFVFWPASFSRGLKTSGAVKRCTHVREKWGSDHHEDDPSSLLLWQGGNEFDRSVEGVKVDKQEE